MNKAEHGQAFFGVAVSTNLNPQFKITSIATVVMEQILLEEEAPLVLAPKLSFGLLSCGISAVNDSVLRGEDSNL